MNTDEPRTGPPTLFGRDSVDVDIQALSEGVAEADAAYLEAARQCLELWRLRPDQTEVPDQLVLKFRVCWPLIAHALNAVEVGVELVRRLPLVAMACARIALEHSLAAQWVLLTDQGEHVLNNHMKHSWLTRAGEFADATGTHEALRTVLDVEPIDGKERSWSSALIFERFDESKAFYAIYRDLTQAVHPSYATVHAHFDISDDDRATGLFPTSISQDGAAGPGGDTALGLGLAAVLSLDALERLRDGSPRLVEVERVARAAGLPNDLSLSDRFPDRQPKVPPGRP